MRSKLLDSLRRSQSLRYLLSLIIIVGLTAQVGCNFKGANELATMGLETGQTLTAYYETLARNTNDTLDMQIAWVALLKRPADDTNNLANGSGVAAAATGADDTPEVTPEKIAKMKKRLDALNSRAQMAKRVTGMYAALRDYSAHDAGAQLGAAASDLAGALSGLIPLPGAAGAAPLIGAVVEDLKNWQKFEDIKAKTRVGMKLMKALHELYQKEATAYTLIAQDYTVTMTVVGKSLIRREMVLSWQLLDKVPATFGLKWLKTALDTPIKDAETKAAFIQIIERQNERLREHAQSATEDLGLALTDFIAAQEKFVNSKTLDLAQAKAFLERARFYLGEIQKLSS